MSKSDDAMIVGKKDTIWEYMAILHPTREESKEGKRSKILLDRKQVLAASDAECLTIAHRALPEDVMDKLDRVEVAVRPF